MLLLKEETGNATEEATLVRVLIADDHPLILLGLRRTLDACEDVEVVGEARCAEEVLALVERRIPDVLLTDLNMPGTDGADLVASVRSRFPEVKVVVLSASCDPAAVSAAQAAGASAFVVKSVKPLDLPSVLRQAVSGAVHHLPDMPSESPVAPVLRSGPVLTERERAILGAVASGHTSKAISGELWLSEHTVKFHLTNIYRKLGVSNRSGAVRYALEHGLTGVAA